MGTSPLECVYKGNVLALKAETLRAPVDSFFPPKPCEEGITCQNLGPGPPGYGEVRALGPMALPHSYHSCSGPLLSGLQQTTLGLRPAKRPAPK